MTKTFTWSILTNGLMTETKNGNADTVVEVWYKITATDGVNTVDIQQVARLTPNANSVFIPFVDLTEAQVIAWVKASLPPKQEQRFEEILTQLLEQKSNPPVQPMAKTAPWNTRSQA